MEVLTLFVFDERESRREEDLPAALDDRGGWLNPDIAEWFAEYGSVMFKALDDRVEMWATLNERWVVTDGGRQPVFTVTVAVGLFAWPQALDARAQ